MCVLILVWYFRICNLREQCIGMMQTGLYGDGDS